MSRLTTLPPELLLYILEYLTPTPTSLLQCTLVCRALLPHTREILFRDIRLVETTTSADRTRSFSEVLESNPDLGSYIHTLRAEVDLSRRLEVPVSPLSPHFQVFFENLRIRYDREAWQDTSHCPDVVGALPLSRLPQLRELVLAEGILLTNPVDQIVGLMQELPALERLSLKSFLIGRPRRQSGGMGPTHPTVPCRRRTAASSLKSLELQYVPRFPLCALVREFLAQFGATLRLQSLVVRCHQWEDLAEHHAGWVPLISAMKTSLRHVNISTGERDYARMEISEGSDGTQPFHTSLFNALRECERLQTLHLEYLLPSYVSPSADLHGADFLQSLCDLLEREPTFSEHLEQISLRMVDWHETTVSVDRNLGNRLAHVLLDSTRYSKLRSFCVSVRIEEVVYSDDELPPLEQEEECDIRARWLDAFAGFTGALAESSGVTFRLETRIV